MIGVLVREGRLNIREPAPVAAWRDPSDPRHRVSIDELLRQTSGQPFGSASTGFGHSARMQFGEPDTAAFAAAANFSGKPGQHWAYTDGNYAILSGLIRDAVGGTAVDVTRFADREIFAPAGMSSVVQEFDQADTPMGGSYVFATARDWTRFGLLFLNDGMAGHIRVLPEGWVDYSKEPTPQAQRGYAAGFWTNIGSSEGAMRRRSWGAPSDSFFGNGDFGQNLLIVPSERLVIARFGFSQNADGRVSHRKLCKVTAEVIGALHETGHRLIPTGMTAVPLTAFKKRGGSPKRPLIY
jgi:CubicO group peptidase (beta-lactamase class C family)